MNKHKIMLMKIVALLTICSGISTYAGTVKAGCIITEFSQVSHTVGSCSNIVISNLNVPAGKILKLSLKTGTTLTFEGTTTFGVHQWDGPLITFAGQRLTVKGAQGSILDGQGAQYWDGLGQTGSKKPVFMKINVRGGSSFENINLLNCPRHCVSLRGSDISVSGWNIDVSAGDVNKLGHNTDGFDVSGSHITIRDSVVKNQDDCIVVNHGSDMHFQNVQCSGGHGLSLSVGKAKSYESNLVSNITFLDCSVIDSDNGIHVKTHKNGGQGLIKDVNYSHITLRGIRNYGIEVQQAYGGDYGPPTNNVPIRDLTLLDVKGDMTGDNSVPIHIVCADQGCFDWNWSEVNIIGNKPCDINYHPSGFNC
ncbi:hypothetical protein JTB14_019619 [Gonioctena quinquepunctata]|nr:hypothetical protein JTB14_019619 [Gonioctena quinquepunctata]